MQINFNPGELSLEEARGIVALLLAVHGDGVLSVGSETLTCGAVSVTRPVRPSEADRWAACGGVGDDASVGVSLGAEPIVDIDPAAAFGGPQNGGPVADVTSAAATPTTAPPPSANASAGSTFDSAGVPWDERIHSSGRTLVKDGTWRRKGGISDDEFNRVMAELKGAPPIPPAPVPAAPVAPPPPSSTAPVEPTPPPAPPVSPVTAPVNSLPPFPAFMTRMMPFQAAGKITLARISEIAQSCGVAALPALAGSPELIPTVEAMIMAEVGAQ